ncbi:MAG: OprF rane domain [Gammaproteobacteria bacterium]|nr:OprF rane domain [Gammaproteobacteria bacterium]
MKKTLLSLAAVGVMAVSGAAFALSNVAGTYYMPLEVGVYHADPTRDLSNSIFGSIGLGYNVTPYFAVQANAGAMQPQDNNSSNLNGSLVDVEGKFSLPTQTSIMPFALLGAGVMKMVSTNPMADGGVGLAYAIAPNVNANATYRLAYQFGQGKSDAIATLGLSWNFGAVSKLSRSSAVVGS